MRILHYWRYPGCGAHARVYLKDGLVAVPAKYGNCLTLWDVSAIKHPRLVADFPDRRSLQRVSDRRKQLRNRKQALLAH